MTVDEENTIKDPFENQKIFISGRIWHELYPKVDPGLFLLAICKDIDLSKYGNGLNKFYFTFIAENPGSIFNTSGTYFSRKWQEAEIAIEIPYDKVVEATEEETIKLMEAAYLEGIDLIETLPLQSEFDVATFKKDVEAIFAKDKWWEVAMAA